MAAMASFSRAAPFGLAHEENKFSITLNATELAVFLSSALLLGICIGYLFGKNCHPVGANISDVMGNKFNSGDHHSRHDTYERDDDADGPTVVLRGSLDLVAEKWGKYSGYKKHKRGEDPMVAGHHNVDCILEDQNSSCSKVVEYLSPKKMKDLLFPTMEIQSQTLRLDESFRTEIKSNKRIDGSIPEQKSTELCPQEFLRLLQLIMRYSVDTSHPYFFNQLFGSIDPIALAAEIVALSVNTSVYTYETAPVFTLMEREVMNQLGNLIFGDQGKSTQLLSSDSEGQYQKVDPLNSQFAGEGLMLPGGSLANLAAMHAARHRWRVLNGYIKQSTNSCSIECDDRGVASGRPTGDCWSFGEEEKKTDDIAVLKNNQPGAFQKESVPIQGGPNTTNKEQSSPDLVAFVSSEAHYSFAKSARVLGMRDDDIIVIPTLPDGRMDVNALAKSIEVLEHDLENQSEFVDDEIGRSEISSSTKRWRVPFFVACTAGSTVRGSFDDVKGIVRVCRDYESRGSNSASRSLERPSIQRTIWVHVDGAWGGSAIFSSSPQIRSATRMDEVKHADSFTFNPHKMLGAPQQTTAFIVRHRNALRDANAAGAKYLFDPRKNGAEYDLGDLSYTCGRRTDVVKLWALWKYYGRSGLGSRVDQKVDELQLFVEEIRKRPSFALACKPWPFNVNFFFIPPRICLLLRSRGIQLNEDSHDVDSEKFFQIPDDIADDLAAVSVTLKLRLHEAGEMIIPYQPLNNQKADCFRLVLAGKKDFRKSGICHILNTMEKYGSDL